MRTLDVLGTEYTIERVAYGDDPRFKKLSVSGYCNGHLKQIRIADLSTMEEWEGESEEAISVAEKATLRHEIVHAFLDESGLQESAGTFEDSWACNEAMVDWIALQGPKIYKAWGEAKAL